MSEEQGAPEQPFLDRIGIALSVMNSVEMVAERGQGIDAGLFAAAWTEVRALAYMAGWITSHDFLLTALTLEMAKSTGRAGYMSSLALALLPLETKTFSAVSFEKSSHSSVQLGDEVFSEVSKVDVSFAIAKAALRARAAMLRPAAHD